MRHSRDFRFEGSGERGCPLFHVVSIRSSVKAAAADHRRLSELLFSMRDLIEVESVALNDQHRAAIARLALGKISPPSDHEVGDSWTPQLLEEAVAEC
jgi:hypothetical protein